MSRITTVGNLTASDIGATVALDGVHVVEGELVSVWHTKAGETYLAFRKRTGWTGFASTADCVVEGK